MNRTIVLAFVMIITLAVNAQEQLLNSGFEDWEEVGSGSKKGDEPVNWSSFLDGTGTLKSIAANKQLEKHTESVRPGSSGSACARIWARSMFGIIAQGNLTTGCVNMGSMTATDAMGNYNYVNEDRKDQAMKFSGRPNAVKVWLKGNCKYNANVAVHLVTKGYYQDPHANEDKITAQKVAQASMAIAVTDDWTEYTIPFVYTPDFENSGNPYYALVNISTSATPGSGDAKDELFVDDMEMVYTTTAIHDITNEHYSNNVVYNLEGQQVSNANKGIVIKNGKKYVVR